MKSIDNNLCPYFPLFTTTPTTTRKEKNSSDESKQRWTQLLNTCAQVVLESSFDSTSVLRLTAPITPELLNLLIFTHDWYSVWQSMLITTCISTHPQGPMIKLDLGFLQGHKRAKISSWSREWRDSWTKLALQLALNCLLWLWSLDPLRYCYNRSWLCLVVATSPEFTASTIGWMVNSYYIIDANNNLSPISFLRTLGNYQKFIWKMNLLFRSSKKGNNIC